VLVCILKQGKVNIVMKAAMLLFLGAIKIHKDAVRSSF